MSTIFRVLCHVREYKGGQDIVPAYRNLQFNGRGNKSITIAIKARLQNAVLEVQSVLKIQRVDSSWGLFGGEGTWGRRDKHYERDT